MILSEYDRRWAEIRLYQFCIEVYQIRHQSIDIFDYTELICDFSGLNKNDMKVLIQTLLNDTYYQASKREIVIIGDKKGLSTVQLAHYLGVSRQGITKYLKTNRDTFTPLPRCNIEDDYKIVTFLNTLDKIRKVGSLGDGTFN